MADRRPETVTVLFTDVVGSTAWRTRVGDDVADLRTAEFERASRSVAESFGGTVVKSVGDGITARRADQRPRASLNAVSGGVPTVVRPARAVYG